MIVIVGLGNPGKEYSNTRHNVGFSVLDMLSEKWNIPIIEKKMKALIGKGIIDGQKVLLVKPQTYMNLSGESLREVVDYYKVDPENEVIVIYDDIALPVGALRVRPKGSAGGHNGIKNIILHLHSETFLRIRVGVGEKPSYMDLKDYVLGRFSPMEGKEEKEAFEKACDATVMLVNGKVDEAMNLYNRKVSQEK